MKPNTRMVASFNIGQQADHGDDLASELHFVEFSERSRSIMPAVPAPQPMKRLPVSRRLSMPAL